MKLLTELAEDGKTFLKLSYNHTAAYLYGEWSGVIHRHQAIDGCNAMLAWAKEHAGKAGCVAAVNDSRQVRGSWDSAIEWANENFNGPMFDYGIRYNAIILSKDLSAQASAESMVRANKPSTLRHHLVMSLPQAEAWLNQMRRA
jgi:hypothetical protein